MMTTERSTNFWKNPFNTLSSGKALFWGLLAILLTGILGYFSHTHNGGVLDVKLGHYPLGLSIALPLLVWFLFSLLLWLIALLLRKGGVRFFDLLGYIAFSRLPMLLPILAGFLVGPDSIMAFPLKVDFPFAFFLFTCILAGIVSVALAWQAFSICANRKGFAAVALFVVALIVIELGAAFFKLNYLTQQNQQATTELLTSPEKALEADDPRMKVVAEVVEQLQQKAYASVVDRFTPELQKQLPQEKLEQIFSQVTQLYGNLQQLKKCVIAKEEGSYTVTLSLLQMQKAHCLLTVTLDSDLQIAGLYIAPAHS